MATETIYKCDVTGKKLSTEAARKSEEARALFMQQNPGVLAQGLFAEHLLPYAPEYWAESDIVIREAAERARATVDNHMRKFFQQKIVVTNADFEGVNASKKSSRHN